MYQPSTFRKMFAIFHKVTDDESKPAEKELTLKYLPEDLLGLIFTFLSIKDIPNIALTCKAWNMLLQKQNTSAVMVCHAARVLKKDIIVKANKNTKEISWSMEHLKLRSIERDRKEVAKTQQEIQQSNLALNDQHSESICVNRSGAITTSGCGGVTGGGLLLTISYFTCQSLTVPLSIIGGFIGIIGGSLYHRLQVYRQITDDQISLNNLQHRIEENENTALLGANYSQPVSTYASTSPSQ